MKKIVYDEWIDFYKKKHVKFKSKSNTKKNHSHDHMRDLMRSRTSFYKNKNALLSIKK